MEGYMTTTPSRRSVLAGVAAVLPATAVALPVEGDDELRRLWVEYLARVADYEVAFAAYKPVRNAFDAELPPFAFERRDEHHKEFARLWIKYGMEPLSDAWNEACDRVRETIALILAAKATTPFGLAVKLVALPRGVPDKEDYTDAVRSAVADVDALLGGTTFATAFVAAAGERFEGIDADDDGNLPQS
jgi:hypothetical protein